MLTSVKKEFITFNSRQRRRPGWGLAQGLRREIGSGFDCMASNTWQDAQSIPIHSPSPHQKSPGCSRTRPDTARLNHVRLPFPSTRPSRPPPKDISVSNVHLKRPSQTSAAALNELVEADAVARKTPVASAAHSRRAVSPQPVSPEVQRVSRSSCPGPSAPSVY